MCDTYSNAQSVHVWLGVVPSLGSSDDNLQALPEARKCRLYFENISLLQPGCGQEPTLQKRRLRLHYSSLSLHIQESLLATSMSITGILLGTRTASLDKHTSTGTLLSPALVDLYNSTQRRSGVHVS